MANNVKNGTANKLRWWNSFMATLAVAVLGWGAVEINGLGKSVSGVQTDVSHMKADIRELKDQQGTSMPAEVAESFHSRVRFRLDSHEERLRDLEIDRGRGGEGGR